MDDVQILFGGKFDARVERKGVRLYLTAPRGWHTLQHHRFTALIVIRKRTVNTAEVNGRRDADCEPVRRALEEVPR